MQTESMNSFVKNQTNYLRELWFSLDPRQVELPVCVSYEKKQANEEELQHLLDWIGEQLDRPSGSAADRKLFSLEAVGHLKRAGKAIFGLTDEQVNCFEALGIDRSA